MTLSSAMGGMLSTRSPVSFNANACGSMQARDTPASTKTCARQQRDELMIGLPPWASPVPEANQISINVNIYTKNAFIQAFFRRDEGELNGRLDPNGRCISRPSRAPVLTTLIITSEWFRVSPRVPVFA